AEYLADFDEKRDPRDMLYEVQTDLGVHEGKIVHIGPHAQMEAFETMDCQGLHILPGLIDTQVHFRDPGLTHKEDLSTGSLGALKGGITGFFDMPNTTPATTSQQKLIEKLALAKEKSHVNYAFYSGVEPETIDQLGNLEKMDHSPGLKVFLGLSTGHLLIRTDEDLDRIFRATKRRVVFHSEDDDVMESRKQYIIENDPSSHPVWRNEESALRSTNRILAACEKLNRSCHILHLTTEDEIHFLKRKRKWATMEVLPQHLLLNAPECYSNHGTFAQQNPPIRSNNHRLALRQALKEGYIDVIASDHAPHTLEEKKRPYPKSPSGMPGVQTLVPLMLNEVNQGLCTLAHFTALMTESPRRIFKIQNKGRIQLGYDADLTFVDMKKRKIIEKEWLVSKCGWSVFEGRSVEGWVQGSLIGGKLALWDDQVLAQHLGRPISFA
ncbi:MAG: dihydroorotase, partial [Pseudobdellovibrionaceae bacterium]